MIKTIIADDHPIFLKGFELMLSYTKKYKIIATASDGVELKDIATKFKADLILVDYRMPLLNGIEVVALLKKKSNSKIVLVTSFIDEWIVEQAKEICVEGIICKSSEESDIIDNLDKIMKGEKIFPSNKEIYNRIYEPLKNKYNLTQNETNTIKDINNGMGIKEIAAKNFVSVDTVKSRKKTAFEKLKISKTSLLAKILKQFN